MSYPTFKFKELVEEEWEDSAFGNYLRETRFSLILLFCFNRIVLIKYWLLQILLPDFL